MFAEIIEIIVNDLQKEFSIHPYDFTSYEIEAQVRVYEALKGLIKGNIYVNNDQPVPKFINETTTRLKLEWKIDSNIHDIVIFKEGINNPISYKDVEAFIEIKATWGENRNHLLHYQALKDFELLSKHKDIGYLIMFIANEYNSMTEQFRDFYKKTLNSHKTKYGFTEGHAFLVFRDIIIK